MAGAGAGVHVARPVHQKQVRRRAHLQELRGDGRPLSAGVSAIIACIPQRIVFTCRGWIRNACSFLASLVTVFGEFDISGELEAKRSVTKNVKRVLVHREYDAATFENDLALLELESPIHYDTHIGEYKRHVHVWVVCLMELIAGRSWVGT